MFSIAPSTGPHSRLTARRFEITIVIATRNRRDPLLRCLESLGKQSLRPDLAVIIDSSDDDATRSLLSEIGTSLGFPFLYEHVVIKSAASQRNIGADRSIGDIVVLLDDDVVVDGTFLQEIVGVFTDDTAGLVGGVSGTITNEVYSDPRGLNRLLLGLCIGSLRGSYAGKLIGPAVNFLPDDAPDVVQEVEWLPTTCTAYRRDVFLAHRFSEDFKGYSFAEDVHLSSRIHRTYRLLNTTRARVYHHDLGKSTHKDWRALGESMVVNRHLIMTSVLGRRRAADQARLFGYEIIYTSVAWLAAGMSLARLRILGQLLFGKLAGFRKVWASNSILPQSTTR